MRTVWRLLVGALVVLPLALGAVGAAGLWRFERGLPDPTQWRALAQADGIPSDIIPLTAVPGLVRDAFCAGEEPYFFHRPRANPLSATLRVALGRFPPHAPNLSITIAKHLLMMGGGWKGTTMRWHMASAVLTYEIEWSMSKDQILEAYLNLVTLGNGATGIGAASQTYFSKPLTELTLAEVAYLAGLPKSPDDLSRNDAKGVERRNRVLDTMLGAGMISADQAASAKAQALGLRPDNPA